MNNTIDSTPGLVELAERLIEVLTAIHREALHARIAMADRSPLVGSEISGLGVDALFACQRLQLLTGLPAPVPSDPEVSRMADLPAAGNELINLVGHDLNRDVQLAIDGVVRVQSGVRRYAELA